MGTTAGQAARRHAGNDSGTAALGTATVVALDLKQMSGASDESGHPPYQIEGFPRAREMARLILPRTCINRAAEQYNRVWVFRLLPGAIEAITDERHYGARRAVVIYRFNPDLSLAHVQFDDDFRNVHNELEADHLLDHPFSGDELMGMRAVRDLVCQ